ncbi:MAG: hypothetical protein WBE14_22145 [Xanthobacteraceae bacterium]
MTEWNERRAVCAPLLFSPTSGAAIAAQLWHLHVRCPGCCCTQSIEPPTAQGLLARLIAANRERHEADAVAAPAWMLVRRAFVTACRATRPLP